MNEDWIELGSFTVTDKDSGQATRVELLQARNEDGSPAAEYELNLNHQTIYIPAEAMPELHWLLGKVVGDKTADNLRPA